MINKARVHNNRLRNYSSSIRSNKQLVEYVLKRASQVKGTPNEANTLFPLISPPVGKESTVDWKSLYVWMPDFQESLRKYLRAGYLPLGTIEMDTAACEVFADIVPATYRQDILIYANSMFPVVYQTTVRVTAELARQAELDGKPPLRSGRFRLELAVNEIPGIGAVPNGGAAFESPSVG